MNRDDEWARVPRRAGQRLEGYTGTAIYRAASLEVPEDRRVELRKLGRATLVNVASLRRHAASLPLAEIRVKARASARNMGADGQ